MAATEDGGLASHGLRRLILKLLLASLGVAAAAGIGAVLLPVDDIMFRIVWSGVLTAVCAGVAMFFAALIQREKTRPGGLVGLLWIMAIFAATLLLIWITLGSAFRSADELAGTIGAMFLAGLPIVGLSMYLTNPAGRIAAIVGSAMMVIAFVFFLIGIWIGWRSGRVWEPWATGWSFEGFGLVIAGCLAGVGTERRWWWQWIGVGAAVFGMVLAEMENWNAASVEELLSLAATTGCFVAFVNLVVRVPIKSGQRWLRIATIGAALLTALLVNVLVFTDLDDIDSLPGRLLAASSILTACGTLAMIVLKMLNTRGRIETPTSAMIDVELACPCCQHKHRAPIGESRCPACDLGIRIQIEEPRCLSCGYLLHRITSGVCPECGTPVRKGTGSADPAFGTTAPGPPPSSPPPEA